MTRVALKTGPLDALVFTRDERQECRYDEECVVSFGHVEHRPTSGGPAPGGHRTSDGTRRRRSHQRKHERGSGKGTSLNHSMGNGNVDKGYLGPRDRPGSEGREECRAWEGSP